MLFTGEQARAVAIGFANSVRRSRVTIWACAILPDHVHLVVARHRLEIEVLASLLKGEATRELVREGIRPFQGQVGYEGREPSCFGRKWWVVYKDNEEALENAIGYTQRNPVKAGLRPQNAWSFVTKYPNVYQPEQEDEQKKAT